MDISGLGLEEWETLLIETEAGGGIFVTKKLRQAIGKVLDERLSERGREGEVKRLEDEADRLRKRVRALEVAAEKHEDQLQRKHDVLVEAERRAGELRRVLSQLGNTALKASSDQLQGSF